MVENPNHCDHQHRRYLNHDPEYWKLEILFKQTTIFETTKKLLTGYPDKVIVCEWSAVTIINVSLELTILVAMLTALENSAVSSNAICASVSWSAWSIRPPSTNRKNPFGFVLNISIAFVVISLSVGILFEKPDVIWLYGTCDGANKPK